MTGTRPRLDDDYLESLLQQTEAAVAHWVTRARDVLELSERRLPLPDIRYDLRGRAAGQAVLSQRRGEVDELRINARMLAAHTREMIDVTVPHEVAHVAIHRCYNRRGHVKVRPHGAEWKALMAEFGVSAETCHNMPTQPARRLRHFPYNCGCSETVWLTSIRHKRAMNGTVYKCRRCGQRLQCQRNSPA